jgi:hypothetical protein
MGTAKPETAVPLRAASCLVRTLTTAALASPCYHKFAFSSSFGSQA